MESKKESDKLTIRDAKWLANFNELKEHVSQTGHFANKHTRLNAFVKYTRKKLNAGALEEWKKVLFLELAESRSDSHTGGRRKKEEI